MITQRHTSSISAITTLLVAISLLAGCDSMTGLSGGELGPSGSSAEPGSGEGTMTVLLTDDPFPYDLVDEANVTITSVEAQSQSEGRIVLTEEAQSFNLLNLQDGITDLLAENTLPAGAYQQLRLRVSDTASVVLNSGKTFSLKVPSQTIKLNLDSVTVEEGEDVALTLDFAVDKSFVARGNVNTPAGIKGFIFKPTVQVKGHAEDSDDDGKQELEGNVESVGADYLVVAGRRFEVTSDTELKGFATLSALSEGESVEIEFVQTGENTYRAVEIEREDDDQDSGDDQEEMETEGTVTAIGSGYLEVDSTRYEVDAQTAIEEAAGLNAISVGTNVEVTYVEADDGTRRALKVEVEDSEGDNEGRDEGDEGDDSGEHDRRGEVTGAVEAVHAASIEVDGKRYYVNGGTRYEGSIGAGGLAALTAGATVEIQFVEREDGTFLAKVIELEARNDE